LQVARSLRLLPRHCRKGDRAVYYFCLGEGLHEISQVAGAATDPKIRELRRCVEKCKAIGLPFAGLK